MFQIAYVNGRYVTYNQAYTHVDDRGYQFADGIYEVILYRDGKFIDYNEHMERLKRSLHEMQITTAPSPEALKHIMRELIERSHRRDGLLYLQITRGVASRDHAFPTTPVKASVVIYLGRPKPPKRSEKENGVAVITVPETRWARRDIKSINLLPNAMAKQKAVEAKVREAVFVDADGTITEGSSTNLYIVNTAGEVITRQADNSILAGCTRRVAMAAGKSAQIKFHERPFTLQELQNASEAFLTSSSAGVLPIVMCDNKPIGGGKPGTITKRLMELYDKSGA